ncbi:MAG: anti-sigma factor family protein [Roseiflexus sp.]
MDTPHHKRNDLDRCRGMLAQLNDYLDGELAESLCRELEYHLAACPDCRTVYDTLSRTIRIYRSLRDEPFELPPGVEERLIARITLALQEKTHDP